MASAEQLKALLKSHLEGDDQRFFSVAMQVAAHEAKLGHGKLAEELRALIDEAKRRRGAMQPIHERECVTENEIRSMLLERQDVACRIKIAMPVTVTVEP